MTDRSKTLMLVMPPQSGLLNGFAAGLISLANYVRSHQPEVAVELVDFSRMTAEEAEVALYCALRESGIDKVFVGITSTTASYRAALRLMEVAKAAYPLAVTIMGGHHVSADSETVLRAHARVIDLIVVGEGERALNEVIRLYPLIDAVPGLAFLRGGLVLKTEPSEPLTETELDGISAFYGERGVVGVPGKLGHVTYVSARGCPLKCAFCAVGNDRIRAKSAAQVFKDIEKLVQLGYRRIAIEDNFFAHSPKRTREICGVLSDLKRTYSGFSWDCQTRVEAMARPDTLSLLSEAGCEAVFVGVESLVHAQLYYLNKTPDPQRYLRTLRATVIPRILDTNVSCYINLQLGLPRETQQDYDVTADYLESIGRMALAAGKLITVFPQLHVIYPGTPHFRQGVAEGLFHEDIFEAFTEWEAREKPILVWLGEHFAHGTGGLPLGILRNDLLKQKRFLVEPDAIAQVSTALRQFGRVPGIRVFQYGSELV